MHARNGTCTRAAAHARVQRHMHARNGVAQHATAHARAQQHRAAASHSAQCDDMTRCAGALLDDGRAAVLVLRAHLVQHGHVPGAQEHLCDAHLVPVDAGLEQDALRQVRTHASMGVRARACVHTGARGRAHVRAQAGVDGQCAHGSGCGRVWAYARDSGCGRVHVHVHVHAQV
eukprot:115291-Chlamydomonas_euryale.AAC.4